MSFITKKIEKKLGVDLDGDGMVGGRRHGVPVGYHQQGQGNNALMNELEKTTNIDLNGDGRIGVAPIHHSNSHHSGSGGLINKIERSTNMDLNGDGTVGGRPNYHPNYPSYGGPSYPPPHSSNFQQPGSGLINELEKTTNIDLNHDGRIGGQPGYPPPHSNFQQPGGNSGMINELEKATNIDINRDGRIGGQPGYPPNYPPNFNQYGGPPNPSYFQQPGNNNSMINELEKATNIDINRDGRIGGQSGYPPNYPPNFNQYGGPPNYPPNGGGGASMINELEKATNIDINGDGRIGGQPGYPPNYPPNFNQYGGPPNYPPNGGAGGAGLINELEKATNIDLNGDGRIDAQPPYRSNYNLQGYGY